MLSQPTEGSPHPVSLGECVDDDGDPHGGHHAQVGEREVHHEHVGGGPQGFDLTNIKTVLQLWLVRRHNLEKYIDDATIAKNIDDPEEEV